MLLWWALVGSKLASLKDVRSDSEQEKFYRSASSRWFLAVGLDCQDSGEGGGLGSAIDGGGGRRSSQSSPLHAVKQIMLAQEGQMLDVVTAIRECKL